MLKQFEKNDIDIIMKIWKDNNQKFQPFIPNEYWSQNYVILKNEILNNKVFVYTEATRILAFVALNEEDEIVTIQVLPEIQREGIGKLLVEKIKKENENLITRVFKQNSGAILFFKALGFKIIDEYTDENTNETCYLLRWSGGDVSNVSFIYFNNSVKKDLIKKYDLSTKVHFYNINTTKKESTDNLNINIADDLENKNNKVYIKDYIDVRNKLSSIIKTENVIIYFDCNEPYDYLYEIIKDITKVRNTKLNIVMHKPFSVEGTKKLKIYESIKQEFSKYKFIEIDYEEIGKNLNINFKDAFDSRDEEMLKTICLKTNYKE